MSWVRHVLGVNEGVVKEFWMNRTDPRKIVFRDVMYPPVVEHFLEKTKAQRNKGVNKKAQGRLVAEIPVTHWFSWRKEWRDKAENVMSWEDFRDRKLNDREHGYFRTWEGRI